MATSSQRNVAAATLLLLVGILSLANGFNLPNPSLSVSRQITRLTTPHTAQSFHQSSRLLSTFAPQFHGNVNATNQDLSSPKQLFLLKRNDAKKEKASEQPKKAATVASSTVNLIKIILGTGVLALPSGVAAVSDMRKALLPASALMLGLGLFSAYTFQLYGRLAHETQATTLGETWERTIGEKSSWVISAGTFSFCFGLSLVYALVIGDFLTSLAMSFGSSIPALFAKRQFWILSVTLSTLYPLCNLKSLAALAPMSMIGTAGTLLTTIFMAVRCPSIVPSSPYSVTSGAVGSLASTLAPSLAPRFGSFCKIFSPAALIIMSMATTAYLGHFNAPDLYHGFKEEEANSAAESNEKAIKRYNKMTAFGFIGATLMNIVIMTLGFLTFGGNSAGVVLNNYATADKGAVMSRLLMTLSVIGGYPFMVGGCKSNFVQLYNKFKKGKKAPQDAVEKWVVRSVIGIATALALVVRDAGLVVSLDGALMGSIIIYTFPAMMFLSHTSRKAKEVGGIMSRRLKLERFTARFLAAFGIVSGLIGAAVSVVASCAPHLLR